MNKIVSYSLLGVGVILIASGFVSYENATAVLTAMTLEEPTDMALWLAICGLLSSITGAFGLATEREAREVSR